ncbi:TetR family transcriptional regulator [Corynebacterium sp. HMSC074C05]|nr:TetR family transcriptional regulator [Corynebacterium sp. HMSC074C05]
MHLVQIDEKASPRLDPGEHPECSLRELKRFQTHCALADAATTLVLDRGYDHVNIEDICQRVNISRRTFFNYFDSKDQSIFGNGIMSFDADDEETFLAQTHQDPIADMLNFIEKKQRAQLLRYKELGATEEFHCMLKERIREILRNEPKLSTVVISNFGSSMRRVRSAFERYFEMNPQSRTHPELPVEHEVALSVGFVRECVLYSSAHRDEFTTDTPLHDAADVVKNFWRRNSDS